MRNKSVRIAKYSYIDKNINANYNEQLKSIIHSKSKTRFKIYGIFFAFFISLLTYANLFYDAEISTIMRKISDIIIISDIRIENNEQLSKEEIINSLELSKPLEFTEIDMRNIKNELMKNSLIKEVDLKINLPNQLIITIKERRPVAAWLDDSNFHLIDEEGRIVRSNIEFKEDAANYILVTGMNSNKKLKSLMDELQNHEVIKNLFAAQLISDRRWNILLKDGLVIKLPENNIKESLIALNIVLENYRSDSSFNIIDLRLAPHKVYAIF